MGAKLAATVYVTEPGTNQTVRLDAGTEPEPRLAALVTNPSAWEDGKPPAAAKQTTAASDGAGEGDEQATAKTGARKPARSRKAADEGSGGR